jgi:hypothetical protein
MRQATVRISEHTRETLRELAQTEDETMQAVLERAVEEYRRKRFIDNLNAFYAELRNDPEAWKAHEEELALWDGTLADGLPEDEVWDPVTRTARFVESKKAK